MGNGAQVFLGSAELGAVISLLSKLPTPAEYFEYYNKNIEGNQDDIYKYLQFDEETGEALYKKRDL